MALSHWSKICQNLKQISRIDVWNFHLQFCNGNGIDTVRKPSRAFVNVVYFPFRTVFVEPLYPKLSKSSMAPNLMKIGKLDDSTETPLGPNCEGELLIKGPQNMKGYLNKPEETKNTFLDGWFKTGDMAYYNDDRLLFITDRLKELIKVKGFQVAPAELEKIIRSFPNVDEAAVIGVPHPTEGEVPRAYVVSKGNAKLDVTELENFVKDKVAHYKQLKGAVAVVDSIPKTASGKIMRRALRVNYERSL